MKSTLLIGIFILLVTYTIDSQYVPETKVNTILYQPFRDATNSDSWIYRDYTYHRYNGQGLLEGSVRLRHSQDNSDKSTKISALKNEYDFQGRLIESENLHYNSATGELNSISGFSNTYEGDQLIRNESYIQNVGDNYQYTEIHVYDPDGHLIEKTDISDYGINNKTTRTRTYQWDENGCLVESSFETDDYSSRTEYDVSETCEEMATRLYEWKESSMQFVLYATTNKEIEYDKHGNIIRKTELHKREGIDSTFSILAEDLFFYDERNRDTLLVHMDRYVNIPSFPINKYQTYKKYDDHDNIIYSYTEYWDPFLNTWIPGHEIFEEYNQENEVIHSISHEAFSIKENKFLSTFEYRYQKNELNKETYSYYKEEDLSQDPPYFSEREQKEQYGCDDRPLKYSTTDLIHGTGYTFEFSYFDQAECDKVSIPIGELLVFPNPARNYIHFKLTETLEEISVGLYDGSGRVMTCIPYHTSDFYSVDVSGLLKGVYVLKVKTETESFNGKFIKI